MADESVARGQPGEPGLPVPQTWLVMLAAVIGALIGVAVVLVWVPGWDQGEKNLAKSGPFQVWAALIAAQAMLWTLALPPLVSTSLRHWRSRKPSSLRREVVPSAGGLVALLVALVAIPRRTLDPIPQFIPHLNVRTEVLTGLAGLAGLAAATSIWLIRGRAEILAAERCLTGAELRTYVGLRDDLQRLLGFLGAVIGLAVLAAAALQHILQVNYPADYHPEVVILYGFILTLFVALVYLPTWATMQRAGSLLRDEIAPLPEPASDQLETQIKKRAVLDDLLGLRVSASVSFKAGVAILTPLLASLTTLLPKLGG